jgi:hypothetical protein
MKKRVKKKPGVTAKTTKAEIPTAPAVKVVESAGTVPPDFALEEAKAVVSSGPMPPDIALREAQEEVDQRFLRCYVETMHVLREKGFSYREIADWLTERGVDVDHNEVYRVYRDWAGPHGMNTSLAQADDERTAQEEAEGR